MMDASQAALAQAEDVNRALRATARQLPLLTVKQTAALESVYVGLTKEVVDRCEAARASMRQAFVDGLRTVRDALAPSGRFKEWCEAAGIKYGTATQALSRADHRSERAVLQSRTDSLPKADPYQQAKITKMVLRFSDPDAQRVRTSLERVIEDQQLKSREAALLHVLDAYEGRVPALDGPLTSGEVA